MSSQIQETLIVATTVCILVMLFRRTIIQRENLFRKYGYCVIRTGTRLYRGTSNPENGFIDVAWLSYRDDRTHSGHIQAWRLKKDIRLLFLVTSFRKDNPDRVFSPFGASSGTSRPSDFQEMGFSGWMKCQDTAGGLVEVCIFEPSSYLERVEEYTIDTSRCQNSLQHDTMSVYPGYLFRSNVGNLTDAERVQYLQRKQEDVQEMIDIDGISEDEAHIRLYNLRDKFMQQGMIY